MKKLLVLSLLISLVLVSCQTEMVSKGVREYEPDPAEAGHLEVDFAYYYSYEDFVEKSDIIGIVAVEELKHVIVEPEDPGHGDSRCMYGEFKFIEVMYSSKKGISDGLTANVCIWYEPAFANIRAPEIELGGEYLVFLAEFPKDIPMVFTNFFDYQLINDFRLFKMEATEDNKTRISELIDTFK